MVTKHKVFTGSGLQIIRTNKKFSIDFHKIP
jgi:hypothetical protein